MAGVSTRLAFLLVSFSLGQLGDGLNIFQGIYLVGVGWAQGAVGTALSLMGLTSLIMQPLAGNLVDTTSVDRRWFLVLASLVTACSASTILAVHPNAPNHLLIYCSKVVEGLSSSFINPCLAALTLASFGPTQFDEVMASNVYWGHVGSVAAAVLAGLVAWVGYPHVEYCFLVIGASALVAVGFVPSLPKGNAAWARGAEDPRASVSAGGGGRDDAPDLVLSYSDATDNVSLSEASSEEQEAERDAVATERTPLTGTGDAAEDGPPSPRVASYWEVLSDRKTCVFCATGFFFHFANANVLLVLGEIMGQGDDDDGADTGTMTRSAVPLTAGAIVTAQLTMAAATYLAGECTDRGWGRKPLFLIGIGSLPLRCALIVLWRNAGHRYLLSTQLLDGIGGGIFGLIHPYIVADVTFGTGRFNAVMGLTASAFGLGATLSNYLGQRVAERYGDVASLLGSFAISIVPIVLFAVFMPETLGRRGGGGGGGKAQPVALDV